MSDNKSDNGSKTPSAKGMKAAKNSAPDRAGTDETAPEFNSVIHAKAKPKNHHEGISRASAMFLTLMATLAGGAIGWLGPSMFKNTAQADALLTSVQDLEAKLKAEISNRQSLETILKTLQKDTKTNTASTSELSLIQSQHGEHINTLSTYKDDKGLAEVKSNLKILTSRMNAQEALATKNGEASAGAQALLARITELETHISHLQLDNSQVGKTQENIGDDFPASSAEPITLPNTQPAQSLSAQERTDIIRVLVESFPRADMLSAVQAQNKIAAKKPSWLQKTLSKHIKVRDDNTPPLTLINAAEKAVKEGRIGDALELIKKLNPPVRIIAQDWVNVASKAEATLSLKPMER